MHSLLLLTLTTAALAYLAPSPSGPYNVTLTTGPLIDYTRTETVAGKPTPRTLMLSIFQPATCASTIAVPYMPKKTAKYQGQYLETIFNITEDLSPLFVNAQLPVCPENCGAKDEQWPILLFQPGYSIPRLYYSALASSVASEGFVVITIDSPDDANIITYPDGSAVYNTNPNQTVAVFRAHLPARITDAVFVLDQLSNSTAMGPLGAKGFNTDKVAMFGHSLGGVAAVLAAAQDRRLKGANNWDGSFDLQPPESGVSQPTLLISHGDADATWPKAWPRLHGEKVWVNVANATHEVRLSGVQEVRMMCVLTRDQTFSDVPSLLKVAGEEKELQAFGSLLGTIEPAEMRTILTTYTTTWMQGVFAGREGGPKVQAKQAKKFPEISIVKEGNL